MSIQAHETYYEPARPFLPETLQEQRDTQQVHDDGLDIEDVIGKRLIDTRLLPKTTIREENAIATLEVMSRFPCDPKWLIYLPPTMSPSETSQRTDLLEHPDEAFELADSASCEEVTSWWTEMTANGREGMVVKPLDFFSKGRRGITQPAMKCRGPEYLRIIYGPEYLIPQTLQRLRSRGVGAKRSLAFREFALGVEALERFVQKTHSGKLTNASSVYLRSKGNQSTRVFERSARPRPHAPKRSQLL